MKKTKLLILFILGVVFGALAAVGIYFLTVGDVAWSEYVETKLIPSVVLALSAISAVCIAAMPIISKIQTAILNFNQATKDVNNTVKTGMKTEKALSKQDEKIEGFASEIAGLKKYIEENLVLIENIGADIEKILKTVFVNDGDLVRRGYADKIAKIGDENITKIEKVGVEHGKEKA